MNKLILKCTQMRRKTLKSIKKSDMSKEVRKHKKKKKQEANEGIEMSGSTENIRM